MLDATFSRLARRYKTPLSAPTDYVCRRVLIPDDRQFEAAFDELISRLSDFEVWDDSGGIPALEAAAIATEMIIRIDCMLGQILPVITAELPAYMLLCDGGQYARTDYPKLYAALDSAFIDDADYFHVPDLRERFIIGSSGNFPIATTGGNFQHTLTESEMPVHSHTYSPQVVFNLDLESVGIPDVNGAGLSPFQGVTNTAGGGAPHDQTPPYFALKYAVIAR